MRYIKALLLVLVCLWPVSAFAAEPTESDQPLIIEAHWCAKGTNLDDFNPHVLHATREFIKKHPNTCHIEQLLAITGVPLEMCKSQAMIHFMPQWQQSNPDRLYLGADCIPYEPQTAKTTDCPWCNQIEKLDMDGAKAKVKP